MFCANNGRTAIEILRTGCRQLLKKPQPADIISAGEFIVHEIEAIWAFTHTGKLAECRLFLYEGSYRHQQWWSRFIGTTRNLRLKCKRDQIGRNIRRGMFEIWRAGTNNVIRIQSLLLRTGL